MKKPFFDNVGRAFEPFFDTPVSVTGVRPDKEHKGELINVSGTFYACVFDQGFANPMIDADADTSIRTFSI